MHIRCGWTTGYPAMLQSLRRSWIRFRNQRRLLLFFHPGTSRQNGVNSLKQKRAHAISALKSLPRIPEFGAQVPVVDVPTDAEALLKQKIAERQFDVFLCHNSDDKTEVKEIGKKLMQLGLRPWLDEWELQPGLPWQLALEKQTEQLRSSLEAADLDHGRRWNLR
jgi:hypothetical protein